MVSAIFDPARWKLISLQGVAFKDITFHRAVDQGTVRIGFNRPEVRNAFRPRTVDELATALEHTPVEMGGCVERPGPQLGDKRLVTLEFIRGHLRPPLRVASTPGSAGSSTLSG